MGEKLQPQLRFPGFKGDWKEIKLGELMTFKNGVNALKENYGFGYKFINVLDIINNNIITHDVIIGEVNVSKQEFIKNIVEYGDILFQRSSETRKEVGQSNVYLDEKKSATFGGFVIRGKKTTEYESLYIHYLLKTSKARKEITTKSGGSTRYNVGQETLSNVIIYKSSSLPEQQKIADYLSTIDTKINLLGEKKTELSRYKKAMMQKLFSREIRFKDENGTDFPDWEEKRLGGIADRINAKNKENNQNILTISGQKGLINQFDYYKNQYAAKDVTNYLLIQKNDFAYNKSYSKGYPFGAIKRLNNYQEGVLSTLYICFRFKETYNNSYFEHFFESGSFNNNLYKICVEGARNHGLLNVSINEFFNERLFVPSLIEQQKIANFLSAIDEGINKVAEQEKQMQAFKKAMLQQMFV